MYIDQTAAPPPFTSQQSSPSSIALSVCQRFRKSGAPDPSMTSSAMLMCKLSDL